MTPRLLDLFCCAGGAGMGYHRAGFDVVGVDLAAQPNYPFEFVQADALAYVAEHGARFDAIHASPPCQHYAPVTAWRGNQNDHPDLVALTRDALTATGRPWIIENVRGAPVRADVMLCGSHFGLRVKRHRSFESSHPMPLLTPSCQHAGLLPFMHKNERAFADAMGCDWMTNIEARQAIPPAYTEHLGAALLTAVRAAA
jgi:DNA (cytosine-5)-methyltransferase 1